jgi:Membrane-associated lipoprotein involved in thiamine biosynthesis
MKKKKSLTIVLGVLLGLIVVVLIVLWAAFGQRALSYECTNYGMGTYIQQTVYGAKREDAAKAAAKSIGDLENLISWRIDGSDIDRLNQAAGSDWITLDPKTIGILDTSLDVAKKSGGAFEPTILPISSLWDFGGENQHVPSDAEIKKFLQYVDYQNLRIDKTNSTASLKNHYMAVDLGGIGKGAACDEAIAAYKAAGADSAIIAVGGSVGVYGAKINHSSWRIAVRDPANSETNAASMGEIALDSGFVSTSGTYEKQFTQNGVTYHHLLNPKTGYPENNGLVSVTVVCGNGALSDALSTACFILGKDKGMELLSEYKANGIFIDQNNRVYVTENLKSKFKITSEHYTMAG